MFGTNYEKQLTTCIEHYFGAEHLSVDHKSSFDQSGLWMFGTNSQLSLMYWNDVCSESEISAPKFGLAKFISSF